MELEDTDMANYLDDMIDLLQDDKEIKDTQESKEAVKKLLELKHEQFIITSTDEMDVRRIAMSAIEEKEKNLEQKIVDAKTEIAIKTDESEKQIKVKGSSIKDELEKRETEIKEAMRISEIETTKNMDQKEIEIKENLELAEFISKERLMQKEINIKQNLRVVELESKGRLDQKGIEIEKHLERKRKDILNQLERKQSAQIQIETRRSDDIKATADDIMKSGLRDMPPESNYERLKTG
ncbi:tropomyosin alpha-1 chain-like [Mercenaria mercenaria]|uniref:tropomyosin alpha-1 chain-like n=1 Tax=Mercenaria mercenaria TaxID=6596 RepID=UPI00234E4F44|nr:tropomyosin alpha-1 chain-like [Mercenaria mercenaria]